MKILFDSTVKQFEAKVDHERNEVAKSYEKIVEKQRNMILSFEMKYSNMIKSRLDRLEAFTDDLALEQARLNTKTGAGVVLNAAQKKYQTMNDSKFEE